MCCIHINIYIYIYIQYILYTNILYIYIYISYIRFTCVYSSILCLYTCEDASLLYMRKNERNILAIRLIKFFIIQAHASFFYLYASACKIIL
jgi:hypothetical protein